MSYFEAVVSETDIPNNVKFDSQWNEVIKTFVDEEFPGDEGQEDRDYPSFQEKWDEEEEEDRLYLIWFDPYTWGTPNGSCYEQTNLDFMTKVRDFLNATYPFLKVSTPYCTIFHY